MKISTSLLLAVFTINVIATGIVQANDANSCAKVAEPALPSSYQFSLDYQTALYNWASCFKYKQVPGVAVDKQVRQTGPFVALKDYGTHPAVRIWYSPEVVEWMQKGRPHKDGKASEADLPDGAFIVKEMFLSPANIYNDIAAAPPLQDEQTGEAYEAMLETLLESVVVMIKDRQGGSADGWYWAQAQPNPNTTYANPPNYNPAWLDNYTSTPLDVYTSKDGKSIDVPPAHFIFSGFSTGTCIRCHASAESEATFSALNNIDPKKQSLQFRVDNSWRSEAYLDDSKNGKSLIEKLTSFNYTPAANSDSGDGATPISGKQLFDRYLKPIWYLPAMQRPRVGANKLAVIEQRNAHLPSVEKYQDELANQSEDETIEKEEEINSDFVAAFATLSNMGQPSEQQIQRFSFPPAYADHSFDMRANSRQKPADHPPVPTDSDLQEYITSDNCVGCHGGLGGAPSGVSQFLQTGDRYGDGLNISPYGEWRWSPMGLAGRDPIFHAQIETELLLLLKENGLLKDNDLLQKNVLLNDTQSSNSYGAPTEDKLHKVQTVQQGLVDTCLRCHGAMGLRQKGLDQSPATINQHANNFSKSNDAVQKLITKNQRKLINPEFDLDNFYRTIPPSAETAPFKPWSNPPIPAPPASEFSDELGNLAREGISCTVCHHIAPPTAENISEFIETTKLSHPDWITEQGNVWTDAFFTFLAVNNTGLYQRSENDQILGPYSDVAEKPMQNALDLTPQVAPTFNLGTLSQDTQTSAEPLPFTQDSAMCGTCHTINLPNIGASLAHEENPILRLLEPNPIFQDYPHSIEQSTYLEWLNSDFGPGLNNQIGADFQSCQDCHMPNESPLAAPDGSKVGLATQIATIQDSNYPIAEHQLPSAEINVPMRADYSRHEFAGLNGFLIKMFEQNPSVLNVNLQDIETYSDRGAELAVDNMIRSTTENRVATIAVGEPKVDPTGKHLVVEVDVENNTGHRFPSGVAFRRAWIQLLVKNNKGKVLWASGKSNNAGIITDSDDKQLATEFLNDPDVYQQHYQEICSEDKVQIYEELTKDADGQFTTSFVHRVKHIKDNRLLPRGWVPGDVFAGGVAGANELADQGKLLREIMRATDPDGVGNDPDFNQNPGGDSLNYRIPLAAIKGAATIEATLYSQALSPAWQWDRFSMASAAKQAGFDTPATDRLYYLMSTLKLADTPMEGWKFMVSRSSVAVPKRRKVSKVPAQCDLPYPPQKSAYAGS